MYREIPADTIFNNDSTILLAPSPIDSDFIQCYSTSELTIIRFGCGPLPVDICLSDYRDALYRLVSKLKMNLFGVDLENITFVPSGLVGVLLSLQLRVQKLQIYHCSDAVMDVLRIAKLEGLVCDSPADIVASNFS